MAILAKFEKQPSEVQDFDIDYSEWLTARGDSAPGPTGFVVQVDAGLTLLASTLTDGVVKIWTSGGENGKSYKITAIVTTIGNRVKQAEITVRVKEY